MPPAIPVATYRLQLTANFDFDAAAAVVPYLKALGISHLYASPFMKARKGSTHGYDIVDHAQFNPELGGEDGFARLSAALKQHDLGLILDFVPNHVGVHFADNPWWLDVLEWGPGLARTRRRSTSTGSCCRTARAAACCCRSSARLMARRWKRARSNCVTTPTKAASQPGISSIGCRSRRSATARSCARSSGKPAAKTARPAGACSRWRRATRGCATPIAGGAGIQGRARRPSRAAPRSSSAGSRPIAPAPERAAQTLALHHLLERQHYRLGHWRLASSDINYRRFFDVNDLAGLRVEDAGTFDAIHRAGRDAGRGGQLQGLRLDHIDGLRDPAQYFQRLRRLIRERAGQRSQAVLHGGRENPRRARSAARPSAASTAPPAMNGSTPSRRCWSTAAVSTRSTRSGGRSAISRRDSSRC